MTTKNFKADLARQAAYDVLFLVDQGRRRPTEGRRRHHGAARLGEDWKTVRGARGPAFQRKRSPRHLRQGLDPAK